MAVFGSKKYDDQAWVDWLSDDSDTRSTQKSTVRRHRLSNAASFKKSERKVAQQPFDLAAALKHTAEKHDLRQGKVASVASPSNKHRTVEIALKMPRIRLPALQRKWLYVATVCAAIVVFCLLHIHRNSASQVSKIGSASASFGGGGTPDFSPLTPKNQANMTNRGYDSKRGVYTFQDKYAGVGVTVSEQLFPDSLRSKAAFDKLISNMQTTDEYSTIHGTLYLTHGDQNSQWMILAHRQLLIFLQSTGTLKASDWVAYVQTLQ